MNVVGYDFMTLGNYDFDYGLERTRELQRIAQFPMRSANIIERAGGEPLFGDPMRVLTVNGIKVGLLALGYHNTPFTGDRANVRGLEFMNGIESARRLVPEMRRHVETIIVVSHQGSKVDRNYSRK